MTRKLALITGGTSGIGFGIAEALASEFDLALCYAQDHVKAEEAKNKLQLQNVGHRIELFPGFLENYEQCQMLVTQIKLKFGIAPSVLVNAAGRIRDGLFLGSDFNHHLSIIQEHLVVPMALTHLLVKDMYRARWGRIINLSSISANYAKRGQTNYAAAKSGIEGFTKVIALETAHRGITVNAVAPGLIETPMTTALINKFKEEDTLAERIPAGYIEKPKAVGDLVKFLCSDSAAYITGSTYTIDGGRSLGDSRS